MFCLMIAWLAFVAVCSVVSLVFFACLCALLARGVYFFCAFPFHRRVDVATRRYLMVGLLLHLAALAHGLISGNGWESFAAMASAAAALYCGRHVVIAGTRTT